MNLFNSVKTQKVSKKTYAPLIREVVTSSDGTLIFQPMKCVPITGDADDFSISNQLKTGVRFDAPNGAFFKENRLIVSDMVQDGTDYLLRITPEPSLEQDPSSEQVPSLEQDPSSEQVPSP